MLSLHTSRHHTDLIHPTAEVRFRFTSGRGSSVQIDDVFVDPRMK